MISFLNRFITAAIIRKKHHITPKETKMATGSYAHEGRLKIARSLADEFLAEISEAQDRLSDEILADEFLADTVEAHDRLRNEIARAVDEFLAEIVKGSAALHKSLGGNETNIRFPLDFIRKRC